MSHIPPLVCDTPPPIDFADSHEDDFGDGIFSNYDGSSLPTTPKQTLSNINSNDLPVDIPELPDLSDLPNVPDFSLTELPEDFQPIKDSLQFTDIILPKVLDSQSNYVPHTETLQSFSKPTVGNSKIENIRNSSQLTEEDTLEKSVATNDVSDSSVKHVNKLNMELQSLDNSTSSHSHSNDNVYQSESPPSLVFSNGSLNCDDNRFDDFDDIPPNADEVESNLPSLKLDSISDSKSQLSELEEVNNSAVGEIINQIKNDDEREINPTPTNIEILNSNYDAKVEEQVDSHSRCTEDTNAMSNYDDSFDDFVEYEGHDQCEELKFNDENSFAADFSQFEAFSEQKVDEQIQSCINNDRKNMEKIQLSENHLHPQQPSTSPKLTISIDDFEDFKDVNDDEFGEFNDFSDFTQSQASSSLLTTDIEELSAKIKPLLDVLFPISDSESEDGSYDALDVTNDTTKIIKDFENSKALDHQWLSSVGKSSLVTSLGIDSRNILYGGKWNNSMPRFAANLGFSPLEPMKSITVSGTTSSTTTSVSSNEIPAAQFDWNSSGLVNPLDASHAHTLLLDLEQLVVVANLDKIKLDSSTCSSTTTVPVTNSTTNNNSMSSLNNHYIHNWDADGVGYQYGDFYGNSLPYSCETNIKTLEKNTNHFRLFDQFLDIRVQEILHKTNAAENQSSRTELDWHSTKAELSIIAPTPQLPNIHTTLNIKPNNFTVNEEQTQTSASYVVPGSSGTLKETHIFTPSKSSFSIPQSREVLNDKHEPKFLDFDYEKAAAGIIIDENVVKKEYRDVEYNPDKLATSLSTSDDFSDFQSVPIPISTQIPHKQHQNTLPIDFGILQPTKPNDVITINWPDPGNVAESDENLVQVATTDLEPFHNFKSTEQINVVGNKRASIDFASIGKSNSSTFDEFSKPVIGVSPSEIMFQKNSNTLEDEFCDFQSVEPLPSQTNHIHTDATSTYRSAPLQETISSNLTMLSHKSLNDNAIEAEAVSSSDLTSWTNYQSPKEADTSFGGVLTAKILQAAPLQPLQILTPQPVNPQPSFLSNTIWPESEIDPDEIARLEAIFPQKHPQTQIQKQSQMQFSSSNFTSTFDQIKSTECGLENRIQQPSPTSQEDDEWSDFVSVSTPAPQPLPITNIISANIAKHQQDDDEWSDFVSSTSQPSIQPWNINSGPNFTSWNAPPQFESWQSSPLYQPPQQFVPTIPAMMNNNNTTLSLQQTTLMNTKSSQNSFFTQKAPSISLIPDLGFVAPKTLVNRSRTNFQNK